MDKSSRWVFRQNNFDLIRLLAALQVAVFHSFGPLIPIGPGDILFDLLRLFPGVPIFFFVSGFFISKSFESSTLPNYSRNRILRIYPALVVCVVLNVIAVWSTGYFGAVNANATDLLLLMLAKSSFLQFYNPDFMRGFGDGVLNGSLWTICVELQFYLLVPILYKAFQLNKWKTYQVVIVLAMLILANRALYATSGEFGHMVAWKLFRVSFLPWLYMFLLGVFVQRNFDLFATVLVRIPFTLLLAAYMLVSFTLYKLGWGIDNDISPIIFLILALTVLKGAYTNVSSISKVTKGHDFSYGVYLWHIPVMNQMAFLGYHGEIFYAFWYLGLSCFLAVASWFCIEKPALNLKKNTISKAVRTN